MNTERENAMVKGTALEPAPMRGWMRHRRPAAIALPALAVAALAIGAFAIGALAIGSLAIGRFAMGKGKIRKLEIDELTVRRFRVIEGGKQNSAKD